MREWWHAWNVCVCVSFSVLIPLKRWWEYGRWEDEQLKKKKKMDVKAVWGRTIKHSLLRRVFSTVPHTTSGCRNTWNVNAHSVIDEPYHEPSGTIYVLFTSMCTKKKGQNIWGSYLLWRPDDCYFIAGLRNACQDSTRCYFYDGTWSINLLSRISLHFSVALSAGRQGLENLEVFSFLVNCSRFFFPPKLISSTSRRKELRWEEREKSIVQTLLPVVR